MGEVAFRQAILHALVAAGITEALLRRWRIGRVGARLAFWVLALAFPFLVLPVFLLAAPFRASDAFAARWALLASSRWKDVRLGGASLDASVLLLLALVGVVLFMRDLVPFAVGAWRDHCEEGATHLPVPAWLVDLVGEVAVKVRVAPPSVAFVEAAEPTLLVRGVRRHTLILSTGLLEQLVGQMVAPSPARDSSQPAGTTILEAALAHELAHIRSSDNLAGWVLMAARAAMFWNPAVQLVARAIVEEMEHRADAVAAAATSQAAVAQALERLAPGDRVTALVRPAPANEPIAGRLVLAAMTIGVVTFFVV